MCVYVPMSNVDVSEIETTSRKLRLSEVLETVKNKQNNDDDDDDNDDDNNECARVDKIPISDERQLISTPISPSANSTSIRDDETEKYLH